MADTSILLAGIEYKVRKLIERQTLLDERINGLQQENDLLKTKIVQQQETINHITNITNTNNIVQSLGNEKETIERSKKRVQQMIGEIDNCLDMLNRSK
jgi:prefoldin subunit 5